MLIPTLVIRLHDPKNGSLSTRHCLRLPFSGRAAGRPLDAFTATEQKTREELVGALLLLQPCQRKVSKQGLEEHSGLQDSGCV